MCGIIGASSKENLNMSDVRLGMMLADERGGHSTGFTDGKIILRATQDVEEFFKPSDKMSMPKEFNTFIGHTRYATAGPKTLSNTHPFNFPRALGVHNGTIDNFKDLLKDFGKDALKYAKNIAPDKKYIQDLDKIESDSMLLMYLIHKLGLKNAVSLTKGTMGIVYYDEDKKLHIYRFDKPMCYGFKGQQLWYASLKEYLEIIGCKNIKSFSQHTHYVIEDGNIIDSKQLPKDKVPEEKLAKHGDDVDPDFDEKEQMKGKPEKKSKKSQKSSNTMSGGSCSAPPKTQVEQEPPVEGMDDEPKQYASPASAKVGEREGKIFFWWFHKNDYNKLCIESEDYEAVMLYNLDLEQDVYALKNDFEDSYDEIREEHEKLELAADVKLDKSVYVEHK